MRVHGTCATDARTDVSARGLTVTIDERIESGGTGKGLSPVETMLASLAGCTNRITHKIAAAKGIEIRDMSVDVEAQFDRRGVTLAEEVDVPFPEIKLTVELNTDADDKTMEALKADLHRFCPISKVIRQSGTRITETWKIRKL